MNVSQYYKTIIYFNWNTCMRFFAEWQEIVYPDFTRSFSGGLLQMEYSSNIIANVTANVAAQDESTDECLHSCCEGEVKVAGLGQCELDRVGQKQDQTFQCGGTKAK